MSTLYCDRLVEVTDQEMVFHRYYFPFDGDRRVHLSQIESIQVRPPSIWAGSWRIWGTGDFRTWFPLDGGRPSRDRIFIASLRNNCGFIGFTALDSQKVAGILRERGLLRETSAV
jgi:hypothetical protein